MKYIVWAVVLILCFILGRIMYAPLGPALLAKEAGASSNGGSERPTVIFGDSRGLAISIDLSSVKDNEFPPSVELKTKASVSADDGSQETALMAGDSVRVIERKGLNLLITAGGPLQGLVPIKDTDFTERVIQARAQKLFGLAIAQNDPPAPPPSPEPAPEPPSPEPIPDPPVAVNDPPAPADPPKPEPEPAPEPAPESGGGNLTPEQIVEAMKASVKGGAIKEFTLDQVQGWKAGDEEEIDGEVYQTGLAAYKAETIFGVKTVQAKALIKDGEVKKWIYSKTGMEIR